ncbi:helix-turn-helix domain-containing protein [Vibrio lentus]
MTPAVIKDIRHKTGLTQKEFCESFGLNLNTYRHWEKGDRRPNASSLVLLRLIKISGPELSKFMKNNGNNVMDTSRGKEFLQEVFYHRQYKSLGELVVSGDENVVDAIMALIGANGFPYKENKVATGKVAFMAGHARNDLKEVLYFDTEKNIIKGELKCILEKTYLVLLAIEKDLREAVYWPQEMRQQRIAQIIEDLEIDRNFYSHILKNW